MPIPSGAKLGSYEIVALLGAGAMGEVYRARDSRLGRDVAVKVLPHEFTRDPDRRARFEREARALAALNHPNIATIHGVEDSAGQGALVMELVDGETLDERITRASRGSGRVLALADVLGISRQIVDALEAAHDKGVVHRDLKPANIKITSGNIVKVLDFGLAKVGDALPTGAGPTVAADGTQAGTLLGTPAYMSPEQVRGEAADARADVWAFGCVLYEMLAGRRAFDGVTTADTLAHVLEREPDWTALPATTPASVRRLTRRCLEKAPRRRLRHIADARFELEDAANAGAESSAESASGAPRGAAQPAARRTAFWAAACLLAGGAITAFALRFAAEPSAGGVTRFSIPLSAHFELGDTLTLAPDGRTLVYGGNDHGGTRLFRRALDALEPEPIQGTEGGQTPSFSPDGASIAFWVGRALKTVPVKGGIARTLHESRAPPVGSVWLSGDAIVFNNGDNYALSLFSIPDGTVRPLTALDAERGEVAHHSPAALPGNRAVLFTAHYGAQHSQRVHVVALETGERKDLIEGNGARFLPPDHLVFQRGGSLWVAPFDPRRLELTGSPTAVIEDVAIGSGWQPIMALAGNGSLAYARGGNPYPPRTLVWVDEAGGETPIDAPARAWWWPTISPDGRRLGLHIMDPVNMDAWIYELDHGPLIRVTYDPLQDGQPVWSPDGTQFAFWSRQGGGPLNIYLRAADLTDGDRRVTTSDVSTAPMGWTPDGEQIVFQQESPDTGIDIGIVAVDGASPTLLLASRADEAKPAVSPDGRWIVYESNVSGRFEVYVQPFPGLGGRWQVSTDGGAAPLWSADGAALYYRRGSAVLSVPVDTASSTFRHGNPAVLFEGDYVPEEHDVSDMPSYALDRDRGRFLMMKQESVVPNEIVVIVDWASELGRR